LLDDGRVSVHDTTEDGESLLSLACSAGYFELAQVISTRLCSNQRIIGSRTFFSYAGSASNACKRGGSRRQERMHPLDGGCWSRPR